MQVDDSSTIVNGVPIISTPADPTNSNNVDSSATASKVNPLFPRRHSTLFSAVVRLPESTLSIYLSLTLRAFISQEPAKGELRAETVCLPYALVPGMDFHSKAYLRAVQLLNGGTKTLRFASDTAERGQLICDLSSSYLKCSQFTT